jgi:hypothetical protein
MFFQAAEHWPETDQLVDAHRATRAKSVDQNLANLIHAQLLREQIVVAEGCPACGDMKNE